jgi:hypothetical protein
MSAKHVARLFNRFELEGEAGLEHKSKNRPSNNRKPPDVRERVSELVKEEFAGMGPTLISEVLEEDHNLKISSETIRGWMTEDETWEPNSVKPRHRRSRPRRACFGELIQMDTSEHAWFGLDQPIAQLIAMIDDATQTLYARFYDTDSTVTNMDCILRYINVYGLPRALYTDRATHFHWTPPEKPRNAVKKVNEPIVVTQIERALKECGIQHIKAHSPEAKGRIERSFKTMQDRLFHRMRLDNITNIEDANEFLDRKYIPKWNKGFKRDPANDFDAHMPVSDLNLKAIFSIQESRVVNNDFTISLHGKRFQIEAASVKPGLKRNRVTVESRLNGEIKIRFKGEYLYMHEILHKR